MSAFQRCILRNWLEPWGNIKFIVQRIKKEAQIIFNPPNSNDSAKQTISNSGNPILERFFAIGLNKTIATETHTSPIKNKNKLIVYLLEKQLTKAENQAETTATANHRPQFLRNKAV